jgi:hypothetical protein
MDIPLSRKATPANLEIPDWTREITIDKKNSRELQQHFCM